MTEARARRVTSSLSAGLFHLLQPKGQRARVPDGERVYIVGDIHGRLDLLDRLLRIISEHAQSAPERRTLIFVGDYIDRGADSRGVIDRLLAPPPGFQARHLRGNHDQAMLDFIRDPLAWRGWQNFGARETLLSYGVRPPLLDNAEAMTAARDELVVTLPASHVAFLEGLELCAEVGDYFVVHAGVRPAVALKDQSAQDMLWIRDEFLKSNTEFGKIIVHGHTPHPRVLRQRNRIGIDTGAYETGRLSALVLEGDTVGLLQT